MNVNIPDDHEVFLSSSGDCVAILIIFSYKNSGTEVAIGEAFVKMIEKRKDLNNEGLEGEIAALRINYDIARSRTLNSYFGDESFGRKLIYGWVAEWINNSYWTKSYDKLRDTKIYDKRIFPYSYDQAESLRVSTLPEFYPLYLYHRDLINYVSKNSRSEVKPLIKTLHRLHVDSIDVD